MLHYIWPIVMASALTIAMADAKAVNCNDGVDPNSPLLSNGFGNNYSNTRNSPSSITSENVSRLALALSHGEDNEKEQ